MQNIPFGETLGSLLFLATRMRPDNMESVSMLAKLPDSPCMVHRKDVKHVVRYLIGTKDLILHLNSPTSPTSYGWSDEDWAHDLDRRRSSSGFVVTVNDTPIIWWCAYEAPACCRSHANCSQGRFARNVMKLWPEISLH